MVFGAASALLVGLLVAAAPSGPPAAHLVSEKQMLWQVVIHLAFVASAIAIAFVDRIMEGPPTRHSPASHIDDYKKTA